MSQLLRCATLAVAIGVIASSGASARVNHNGARAQAVPQNAINEMDIRKQCYAEAKERYPSTNQDMQTNRDFAYRTCAFDRGVNYP